MIHRPLVLKDIHDLYIQKAILRNYMGDYLSLNISMSILDRNKGVEIKYFEVNRVC